MMLFRSFWFVDSRLIPVALVWLTMVTGASYRPATAATILDKTVQHHIGADGAVSESTRLEVRLETPQDLKDWASYEIALADHRSLENVEAWVESPEGRTRRIPQWHQDEVETPTEGALHVSSHAHRIEFRNLRKGSKITVDYRARVVPRFPTGSIPVFEQDAFVASLLVEITGAPAGFRWYLEDSRNDVRVEETQTGLRLIGEGLNPPDPPDWAPGDAKRGPVLRYGWGSPATWRDVALWYQDLLQGLPSSATSVNAKARELTRSLSDSRERLKALLNHVRHRVRYVAVDFGAGELMPVSPTETLARGWGDAKDKSMLFIDLLKEVGIRAYPVLVRASELTRIDPAFPSPFVFDHVLVAVDADDLTAEPDDPVAEGLFFIDPSHPWGSLKLLPGMVQDQLGLVVRGESSGLVKTPAQFDSNVWSLAVGLDLDAGGVGRGVAQLSLYGNWGSLAQQGFEASSTPRWDERIRGLLSSALPGADLWGIGWGVDEGPMPRTNLRASVSIPGLFLVLGDRMSFRLPEFRETPPATILEERTLPVVADAFDFQEHWNVTLPREGCVPNTDDVSVTTPVGSFEQSMAVDGRQLFVERRRVLAERWIEPDQFDALRELYVTEIRARKRRLRLACQGSEVSSR